MKKINSKLVFRTTLLIGLIFLPVFSFAATPTITASPYVGGSNLVFNAVDPGTQDNN